jgi:hypothetical protein
VRFSSACVQDALGHLPMDAVVRRFSEIWQDTDPPHVKVMRRTGRVVETPVRLLMRAAKWVGGSKANKPTGVPADGGETAAAMEADLVRAANPPAPDGGGPDDSSLNCRRRTLQDWTDAVKRPGRLAGTWRRIGSCGPMRVWPDPSRCSSSRPDGGPDGDSYGELVGGRRRHAVTAGSPARPHPPAGSRPAAAGQRAAFPHDEPSIRFRQTFSAMLNIIPATAAVTYVLHTGDPVGAVGIKVKLAGSVRTQRPVCPGGHSGHRRHEKS